jgi:DNA-binding IclR family transcriptional regulator
MSGPGSTLRTHLVVLHALLHADGRPMGSTQLAEVTGLHRRTVRRIIHALEQSEVPIRRDDRTWPHRGYRLTTRDFLTWTLLEP